MKNFKTTLTALITPLKNQSVDYHSLEKLIQHQIQNGIGGFVINGTTAESPTLDWPEVEAIFKFIQPKVPSGFPLIMGTGSNCTASTMKMTQRASDLGADAALVVVPYYNKPPQRGLVAHFQMVAEHSKIPIILYNVPGRTVTSLSLESIVKLAAHPNIIGIKEASGNIDLARQIRTQCGSEFLLLSGDDGTYPEFLKVGGDGVISVASHIIPDIFSALLSSTEGASIYKNYLRLIDLLFAEANPIPVKKSLQLLGLIASAELRLPLCELEVTNTELLQTEMKKVGLL